jgi:oxygen-dependent protoporphyrinogen oxidase
MVKQVDPNGIEEKIYDTVIIGAGIAGLTAGYFLRDRNILLLEMEDRFGGRVLSEEVNGAINNVGTQFFTDEETSFVHLINELGIERVTYDPFEVPMAFYLNNKYYDDVTALINFRVVFDAIRFLSQIYRKINIFKLPQDDPRWRELAGRNALEFQEGYSADFMALINTYTRGACVTKPERTSAGMWAYLAGDVFQASDLAFVTGGFQKITDAMLDNIDGKVMGGAAVTRIEEKDETVTIHFQKDGKEHTVKSKSAVVAVPSPLVTDMIPDLPDWKKMALEKVTYGPINLISVFLQRNIPWENLLGGLTSNLIFQGFANATYDMGDDVSDDTPIIYNFIISIPPDEKEEIEAFMAKTDEEIVELTLKDFKKMMPEADIEKYITDTKVIRYPIGELELTPEYFLDLLPELPKPVGNIHFCGDYTEAKSFVDGAAYSGMRVARELGSQYVVTEEEELKFAKDPKWGVFGWATIIVNVLLFALGFFLPGGYGTTLSIGAGLLLIFTATLPSFFPPIKLIYQALLGISIGFGGIIGLLAAFIGK